jgi:hypothetical protein
MNINNQKLVQIEHIEGEDEFVLATKKAKLDENDKYLELKYLKIKEENNYLKRKNELLLKSLDRINRQGEDVILNRKNKYKDHNECTYKQKKRNIQKLKSLSNTLFHFGSLRNLNLSCIVFCKGSVPVNKVRIEIIDNVQKPICEEETLLMKDEALISDANYSKIKEKGKTSWCSLYRIKKRRLFLNCYLNYLWGNNQNKFGSFVDPIKKIKYIVETKYFYNDLEIKNNLVRLKFCGDGAHLNSTIHLFNVGFVCIDQKKIHPAAEEAFFTLGIFLIDSENYDEICNATKELYSLVREIKYIKIDGLNIEIDWYLNGDMNYLFVHKGINYANSNYPCVQCKIPQVDFEFMHDSNSNNLIRSDIELIQLYGKKKHFGYVKLPLCDWIDFDKIIFDLLHLGINGTKALINTLIKTKLKPYDEKKTRPSNYDKLEHLEYQGKLFAFLKKVGIGYKIDRKEFLPSNVTLENVYKLFEGLNKTKLSDMFPEINHIEEIHKIWISFFYLYNEIKQNKLKDDEIKEKNKIWLQKFRNVFQSDHITPYLHVFQEHIPQNQKLVGDLNRFSCEGLEKVNFTNTQYYYRCSNKKKSNFRDLLESSDVLAEKEKKHISNDFLSQLLNRRNRKEYHVVNSKISLKYQLFIYVVSNIILNKDRNDDVNAYRRNHKKIRNLKGNSNYFF